MTGVFKDLSNKTKFGILFTKHYASIYRDFVRDDHYRSVSATAVTVQIYTVTTIVSVTVQYLHFCNCEDILTLLAMYAQEAKNQLVGMQLVAA